MPPGFDPQPWLHASVVFFAISIVLVVIATWVWVFLKPRRDVQIGGAITIGAFVAAALFCLLAAAG